MRKKLVVALAGVLALAIASVALAVQTQTATITFSSQKAGSPTNITSVFKVGDSANTMPPGKPTRHISRVDINFPRDMTFNDAAYPKCISPSKGALEGGACKSAILGRGTTTVDARSTDGGGLGVLTANLTAYNAKGRGLYILVQIKQNGALDQVLQPKLTKQNVLITLLPDALRLTRAELTNFRLVINPKAGKLKGKKTPYTVLPKKCPKSGKFIIKTKYYFQDYGSGASTGTFTTPGTVNKCHK